MATDENNTSKKPSVKMVVGISCAALSITQLICEFFSFSLPLNLLVDVLSIVISSLITCKVLSGGGGDIMQNAEDIKNEIHTTLQKSKDNDKKINNVK